MSEHPFQNFMIRFRAGERIFEEGEAGATMYIVQAGTVRLERQINGSPQPLGELEKGDFFGEMSILEGLPRTASAEAVEDAELIEINSAIFDKMIRANIEIAIRMLRKLSIRLREMESNLAEFKAGDAKIPAAPNVPKLSARACAKDTVTGLRLEANDHDLAFPVGDGETLIGRFDPVTELRPDIDLTDVDLKRSVSRRHARIVPTAQGFAVVEEVGALNGTFVNDERLVTGEAHPIHDGDRLAIGQVVLTFRS